MPLFSQIFSALLNIVIFQKCALFMFTYDRFIVVIFKSINKFKTFSALISSITLIDIIHVNQSSLKSSVLFYE